MNKNNPEEVNAFIKTMRRSVHNFSQAEFSALITGGNARSDLDSEDHNTDSRPTPAKYKSLSPEDQLDLETLAQGGNKIAANILVNHSVGLALMGATLSRTKGIRKIG